MDTTQKYQPQQPFQPPQKSSNSNQAFKFNLPRPEFSFGFITKALLVILLIILIFAALSFKDNYLDRSSLITVNGQGLITTEPKLVKLKVTFSNTASSSAEVLTGNQSLATAVTQILISKGVKKDDVRVFNASITPIQGKSGKFSYRATNDVEAKFKDVSNYGNVINALFQAGFVNISKVVFTTENAKDLERQAIDMAMKDALQKASEIAKSSGKRLGKIVSITTNETGNTDRTTGEASSTQVAAPQKIDIIRQASVVYQLR